MQDYVDALTASKILGISINTLYFWNTKKLIPYFRPSRKILYLREDIEAYILRSRISSCDEVEASAIDALMKDGIVK